MFSKIVRSCAYLWILGLAGMFLTRAFLNLEPGDPGFEACAGMWGIGGVGYVVLGGLSVLGSGRAS